MKEVRIDGKQTVWENISAHLSANIIYLGPGYIHILTANFPVVKMLLTIFDRHSNIEDI